MFMRKDSQSRKILYGDVQSLASTGFAVKCSETTKSADGHLLLMYFYKFFRKWQMESNVCNSNSINQGT